ncbi:NADH-quinone oxidoreductase subunit J [Chromohalobacter canadensis]|uniref:NADH-quinone oxidoreductase subunit J n=1 Tax=Chromohalobacter canadensis TaxID=141389 RepID=A0A285VA88_9GAMM|nr:NADH-quinone oxidoreductase subunit J [Chromohalobacter canadensis]MCK0769703.1 NADH-quinone oxidoreductase subunit J [Chromohalobacter canadensis]WQH07613.1 NADH-quinone oxidoreductase subunit J [Chromohalobacter canadensis]SOC51042.1 NADH dehydrogenase subunit J [Chromohalobacter canadensis]
MEIAFYLSAVVAVLATLGVVTGRHPVHALLYLIVSLIAVAMVFFALGAPFAGALEIIVYAGAIMVLFVFVVMMLNLGEAAAQQERDWLRLSTWLGPAILSGVLLLVLLVTLIGADVGGRIEGETLTAKAVGTLLFGPYLVVVELAAMLLLAALVAASHLGRSEAHDEAHAVRQVPSKRTADGRGRAASERPLGDDTPSEENSR